MKQLTQNQLSDIVKNKNLDLPVPRLESRNFYQLPENEYQFNIFTYYLLVFEPVAEKIDVSVIDSSIATVPISENKTKFYIGWRREGDILNLMTQLKLRAFIIDHNTKQSKEIFLNDLNCPNGLKTKEYCPKEIKGK